MTGSQILVLGLLTVLMLTLAWIVLVGIPGLVWTSLTIRLRKARRDLSALTADDQSLLSGHPEVEALDHFLISAVRGSHFGLSHALAVLTGIRTRRDWQDDESDPLGDLPPMERHALLAITADALRLTFVRAFLGSCLWFLAWPGAIWAIRTFHMPHRKVTNDNDHEPSPVALIVPIERAREALARSTRASVTPMRDKIPAG